MWLLSAKNWTEIHCVYTGQLVKSAAEKSFTLCDPEQAWQGHREEDLPFPAMLSDAFPFFLSSLQIVVSTMAVSAGFLGKQHFCADLKRGLWKNKQSRAAEQFVPEWLLTLPDKASSTQLCAWMSSFN